MLSPATPARAARIEPLLAVVLRGDPTRVILVTTPWFASGCWIKAHENGRIELIDGRRLRHLVKEHMGKDVLVAPPTGRRRDRLGEPRRLRRNHRCHERRLLLSFPR
jgi:hypothetical protein